MEQSNENPQDRLPRVIARLPWIIAGSAIAAYAILGSLTVWTQSAYLSSVGVPDEQFNYYLVARNFNRHGFANSVFLQDMSSAADPKQHPYVYNHQPPGPEILVSLITRVCGERYRWVRLCFVALFLAGLVCFARVSELLLRGVDLSWGPLVVLLLRPTDALVMMDHPGLALMPLLTFGPILVLQRYVLGQKWIWLLLALCTIFAASLCLMFQHVLMACLFWGGLWLVRRVLLRGRHVLLFAVVVVGTYLLHLGQSFLHLGPSLAAREISYTIRNRATGRPTGEELRSFYREIGVVHHGGHRLDGRRLTSSISSPFRSRRILPLLGLFGLTGVLELSRWLREGRGRSFLRRPWKGSEGDALSGFVETASLVFIASVPVLIPHLLLPAYSSDYAPAGPPNFYVSLLILSVLGYAYRELAKGWASSRSSSTVGRRLGMRAACLAGFLLLGFWGTMHIRDQLKPCRAAAGAHRNPRYESLSKLEKSCRGHVVMTNVDPVIPGFFSQDVAYGGCEWNAVSREGELNPAMARVAWIKGKDLPRPTRFLLCRTMFGGPTEVRSKEGLAELYEVLKSRYSILYEDDLYVVFALDPS